MHPLRYQHKNRAKFWTFESTAFEYTALQIRRKFRWPGYFVMYTTKGFEGRIKSDSMLSKGFPAGMRWKEGEAV